MVHSMKVLENLVFCPRGCWYFAGLLLAHGNMSKGVCPRGAGDQREVGICGDCKRAYGSPLIADVVDIPKNQCRNWGESVW